MTLNRFLRLARFSLTASLMLVVLCCQIQGKKFFLDRIWLGVPPSNLSSSPETLQLQKTPPGVVRLESEMGEVVDFAHKAPAPLVRPLLPAFHPAPSALVPIGSFPPTIDRLSGRSPPL